MSHLRLWALDGRPEVQEPRAFRSSLDSQGAGVGVESKSTLSLLLRSAPWASMPRLHTVRHHRGV